MVGIDAGEHGVTTKCEIMLDPFTPRYFRQLQLLHIRTRRAFLGSRQGGHISVRRGLGLEFSDHRPYTAGDDFRHIDWNVYGRTERLYVKQFQQEQDLNVVVLFDSSRSMFFPEGERKIEMSQQLALSLGYVALVEGDSVTLVPLGQLPSPRFTGVRSLERAKLFFQNLKPSPNGSFFDHVRHAVGRQRVSGRCFLISDFLMPLDQQIAALDFLRTRNFEISVLHVLSPSELSPPFVEGQTCIDAETGEELELTMDAASRRDYLLQLSERIGALERYCNKNAIAHCLIKSTEALSDVVLKRLPAAGILR